MTPIINSENCFLCLIGGGFGGKELRAPLVALPAAVAAVKFVLKLPWQIAAECNCD